MRNLCKIYFIESKLLSLKKHSKLLILKRNTLNYFYLSKSF